VTEFIKVEYRLHPGFDGRSAPPDRTPSATLEIV
jgi:hypothetical protein